MAKEYAYYIEGNKVAIVERDTAFDNNVNSKEYGPGVSRAMWKSPKTSVTDGLEIKYAYNPKYRINDIGDKSTSITGYEESDGLLKFTGSGLSTDAQITYIVISNSEKWNGLHKIKTLNSSYWIVETIYNGTDVVENPTAHTDINVLNDEADTIDIPSYLSKALVYYVKARLAEDSGQIELKEYNMREYKKHIEVYESSLMKGPRIMSSGPYAIR